MNFHREVPAMSRVSTAWMATALLLTAAPAARADDPPPGVKAAIDKALPLVLKGAKGHVAQRTCFACHNQAIPMLALTTAQRRGFDVSADDLKEQLKHTASFLDTNRAKYKNGQGQGGAVDTAGYALFTLELGGWQADETTEAVVEYLLLHNKDLDHWRTTSNRPPSEASPFTTTYVALRGVRKWGTAEQKERIDKWIESVRAWLFKTPAKDTEDRVFRLWALYEAGVRGQELEAAARELLQTQRDDGGWGQLAALDSDAYATGSALVVLHLAGGLATDSEAYRRGVAFLVKTQREDGSWLVKSRSKPFQPYYESGFPHGNDQFISMAATSWAVTALALACPEKR